MRISTTAALIAGSLALVSCSAGDGDSGSADAVAANLEAENFDMVVNSDDVGLNEAELGDMNVATE